MSKLIGEDYYTEDAGVALRVYAEAKEWVNKWPASQEPMKTIVNSYLTCCENSVRLFIILDAAKERDELPADLNMWRMAQAEGSAKAVFEIVQQLAGFELAAVTADRIASILESSKDGRVTRGQWAANIARANAVPDFG